MRNHIYTALIALVFGFGGAALWSISGLGDPQTRSFMLQNADLLPQMANELQRREGEAKLASVGSEATTPFPGAVLGNPAGTKTLVEFTDYGCGFCRSSTKDVEALIAQDPNLRVVVREWPIFDGSEAAARMALAAAKQGKYAAFHDAMFAGGPPSDASVAQAADQAGLDMDAARKFAASQQVDREIARNMGLAQTLGFTGTPSWIADGRILEGAIGEDALRAALNGETS